MSDNKEKVKQAEMLAHLRGKLNSRHGTCGVGIRQLGFLFQVLDEHAANAKKAESQLAAALSRIGLLESELNQSTTDLVTEMNRTSRTEALHRRYALYLEEDPECEKITACLKSTAEAMKEQSEIVSAGLYTAAEVFEARVIHHNVLKAQLAVATERAEKAEADKNLYCNQLLYYNAHGDMIEETLLERSVSLRARAEKAEADLRTEQRVLAGFKALLENAKAERDWLAENIAKGEKAAAVRHCEEDGAWGTLPQHWLERAAQETAKRGEVAG